MDVSELNGETSFAVICSFFNKFGALLGLKPLPFTKIEQLLTKFDGAGRVDKELIDLHVKLLRGVQLKSANHTRWEQSLLKFCSIVPALEAECLQLERFGYVHSPLSTKLTILKVLCECQFDFNPKFKENILGSLGSSELRLLPVGYDENGLAYWYQQDADLNIRIYTEEPDDFSGGTWELKAKSRDELASLLDELKGGPAIPVKEEAADQTEERKEGSDSNVKEESDSVVKEEGNDSSVKDDAGSSTSTTVSDVKQPEIKPEELKQEETVAPEPEPEEETTVKEEKSVKEEKPMKTKNKKGTFMDTFQDEKKTPAKKTPAKGRKGAKGKAEAVKEEDKADEKSDESQADIPDELKPFIDRRIMPRRSARSAALTQIKGEDESPKGKAKKNGEQPKKKKPEPVVE
uniref:Remodeling and spacing factor 1 n=1 Tax=Plectus sambesii TaxID=2011161 RepID=A0A914WD34_9BILA